MRSVRAALYVIALVLGAACSSGSEPHDAGGTLAPATTMPEPTVTTPAETSLAPLPTTAPAPLSIRNALAAVGATMDQAPRAIGPLLDTSTCGLVRITNKSRLERIPGAGERRCFLDSLVTRRLLRW